MKFKNYLDHAWASHINDPKKTADEFKSNFSLMETDDDVMSMAGLIVHIFANHLGEWERGSELLKKLKNNATIKDKEQMNRYVAILNLGNNPNISLENFSPSDQIRIYSATALALVRLGGVKNPSKFLLKSAELMQTGISNEDPAVLDFATSGKKIAAILKDKKDRTASESELMVTAEGLSLKYGEKLAK